MRLKKWLAGVVVGCLLLGGTTQGIEVLAASKAKTVQTKKAQKKQSNKQQKSQKQQVVDSPEVIQLKNRVKEAQLNASKIKSAEATMNMNMNMKMEYKGESLSLPMKMTGKIKMFQEPLKAKVDYTISSSFSGTPSMDKTTMEIYLEEKDGKITEYMNMNGEWQVIDVASEDVVKQIKQLNTMENVDQFLTGITNLKNLGTEWVSGKETTKIEGTLSKDGIKAMLESTGVLQMNNMLEEQELTNKMFQALGNIKLTFWITEDNQIVKLREDMTKAMNKMMSTFAKEIDDGMKVSISKMVITITYDKINDVEDFTIPEEVYSAKKLELPQ